MVKREKKKSDQAEPQQDSKPPAVIFAGAAPPQNLEDLCTVFALPLPTPPASPLRRKTVLEYRFDHFVRVLSAALIPLSVQSVGPNPLMNVFSLPGGNDFKWRRIPAPALGGEQLERTPLLFDPAFVARRALPSAVHPPTCRGGLTAELRLTSRVLARLRLALARRNDFLNLISSFSF